VSLVTVVDFVKESRRGTPLSVTRHVTVCPALSFHGFVNVQLGFVFCVLHDPESPVHDIVMSSLFGSLAPDELMVNCTLALMHEGAAETLLIIGALFALHVTLLGLQPYWHAGGLFHSKHPSLL